MTVLNYDLVTHVLDNGLQVCVQSEPSAPAVAVNLWYEVGSFDEEQDRTGFAHLFEHLMFQGSRDVASGEHMASIEAIGGTVNATTSMDRTNYFETVPPQNLELALWLEANRLESLAITQQNFDTQREVVKEEKRQRYNNQPYGDVLKLLIGQHFATTHPYGHLPIGSMADLEAAELADVKRFFDAWYRPSNARLVICGDVEADEAIELVGKHFSALADQPKPKHRASAAQLLERQTTVVTRDVPHSLLYASWPTPEAASRDHIALDLALGILTEGHTSRLHRRLVQDQGIVEEVHGATLTHLRDSSISMILSRPAAGVGCEEAAAALTEQIRDFHTEGPSMEELRRSKAQYERDWLQDLAAVEGRADAINDAWLTFEDPNLINSRLEEVDTITLDDVRAAVETHLASAPSELHYLAAED